VVLQQLHRRHVHAAGCRSPQRSGDGVHALFEHGPRERIACRLRGDVEAGHNLVELLGIYVRHRAEEGRGRQTCEGRG
jgi:hypothetical protein